MPYDFSKKDTTWTPPFCGVTHLGSPKGGRHWVTVAVYSPTLAVLKKWTPTCGLTPEEVVFSSSELAKAHGEQWLRVVEPAVFS